MNLEIPGAGLVAQTANAAWCLLGVPFILSGVWGLYTKQEQNMRVYLYFIVLSFGLDILYSIAYFATTDVCMVVPDALLKHGTAFACGFMRLASISPMLSGAQSNTTSLGTLRDGITWCDNGVMQYIGIML